MEAWADLLRGVAAVLWPIVIVVLLLIFRPEVTGLFSRLRKAKLLGQEVELDESLEKLNRSAVTLTVEEVSSATTDAQDETSSAGDDVERRVLDEASESPKVALMFLSSELERAVRRILAMLGGEEAQSRFLSLRSGLRQLERRSSLPKNMLDALRQFTEVQNLIVHGRSRAEVSDDEVLRAIDSGLVILRAIHAIPHETHIVEQVDVVLFADAEGKNPREDCTGVILETQSAGGAIKKQGIYPVSRKHFKKGLRVSWEWNPQRKWGETWYRDPESRNVAYAWSESVEFCGRNIDEL